MRLRKVNTSVGVRLLVGFWITIVIALVCVAIIARWSSAELTFEKVTPLDVEKLERAVNRVSRQARQGAEPNELARGFLKSGRNTVLLYDVSQQRLLNAPSRSTLRFERDIQRLSGQVTPIRLIRPPFVLTGPVPLTLNRSNYLLFIAQPFPFKKSPKLLFISLITALFGLSLVYSIIFSKSLIRPISALRTMATELANGKWHTRVNTAQFGRDELGELAQSFNVMAQKIEDNWQSQRRLLADISHELRSPLTRINMAVALAENAGNDTAMASQSLLRIEQEIASMDKLIGDLLKLARTEADISKKSVLSLSALLSQVLDNAKFEAQQKGITLTVSDIPELNTCVQVDAIQSAVENVVRNAIRYTRSEVAVILTAEAQHWILIVNDNGPGLAAEDRYKVFTPFYRTDSARNQQTGGVGLGLAIAYTAIKNNGGEIEANASEQQGLSVTIRLPQHNHEE